MKLWSRILTSLGSVIAIIGLGTSGAGAAVSPDTTSHEQASTGHVVELSEALLDERDAEGQVQLAARFKDRDDHGRPDLFGPPGPPAIGAPGQSGY